MITFPLYVEVDEIHNLRLMEQTLDNFTSPVNLDNPIEILARQLAEIS